MNKRRQMDKKLPICIVLVMLMSCFSCKQPQQPTEDADMDTQWVDSSQHLYQYGICIDSLDVKEYLMKTGIIPPPSSPGWASRP